MKEQNVYTYMFAIWIVHMLTGIQEAPCSTPYHICAWRHTPYTFDVTVVSFPLQRDLAKELQVEPPRVQETWNHVMLVTIARIYTSSELNCMYVYIHVHVLCIITVSRCFWTLPIYQVLYIRSWCLLYTSYMYMHVISFVYELPYYEVFHCYLRLHNNQLHVCAIMLATWVYVLTPTYVRAVSNS